MSITAASASEQAQLDEAAALARATVDAANLNAKEKARVGDAARQAEWDLSSLGVKACRPVHCSRLRCMHGPPPAPAPTKNSGKNRS